MDFAPAVSAKPSIFARIYFVIGLLLFSLLPLVLVLASQVSEESDEAVDIETMVVAIVALQGLLWFAQRRCGSTDRPYWRSLLVVASCLSTGWPYLDFVLVPAGLLLAISLSCALAFTGNPRERMSRLVYWFYHHRMHQ
jgi:hypothetical protein